MREEKKREREREREVVITSPSRLLSVQLLYKSFFNKYLACMLIPYPCPPLSSVMKCLFTWNKFFPYKEYCNDIFSLLD